MWEYIFLSILSAVLFGFANIMQKRGLMQLPILTVKGFFKNIFTVLLALLKNIYWLGGMVIGVLAWFIYIEALSLGDLIVVKPIINLNLVVIVLLSIIFLKEKLRKIEAPFLSIIVLGVILLSYDARTTGSPIINEPILIGIIIVLSALIIILSAINLGNITGEYAISVSAGLSYGVAEIFTKWLSTQSFSAVAFPDRILYFLISPVFWGLALFTVVGFIVKQTALSQGRACISIPLINALSIIIPVITSIAIFGEELILLFNGGFIFPTSLFRVAGITFIIAAVLAMNYLNNRRECSKAL